MLKTIVPLLIAIPVSLASVSYSEPMSSTECNLYKDAGLDGWDTGYSNSSMTAAQCEALGDDAATNAEPVHGATIAAGIGDAFELGCTTQVEGDPREQVLNLVETQICNP